VGIKAGIGEVFLNQSAGLSTRLSNLSIQGSFLHIRTHWIATAGDQIYQTAVELEQPILLSTLTGDLRFTKTLNPLHARDGVIFSLGGGQLDLLGESGFIKPLGGVIVYNSGVFQSYGIQADFLRVSGGLPKMVFRGPVTLSGFLGLFLDGGPIQLGAPIETRHFFIRSRGNITNIGGKHSITTTGIAPLGFDYLNAVGGNIGSLQSPVELMGNKETFIGAKEVASLAGTLKVGAIDYVPSNIPCIVTLNGALLRDCNTISSPSNLFNALPKNLFYVPGLYSSWDNLSNWSYFYEESLKTLENPRGVVSKIFWKKKKKKGF
jgi:hypothetical protein